jgi:MFS family permease
LGFRRRYRRHRGAYLPIRLGTRHAFDTAAFSILLLVSTGAGIVAGEYLFALLSDRFGRRRALARQPGVAAVSLEHGLRGSVAAIDVISAGTTQAPP